ncbi:MAG: 1-(5-phosphoribosyl)-5-[(5-phosphoribosylamino)methylideneamino]imidazole-4-carboxamide isomerase [Candidatus Omnitrophota bacterium]
MLIIPAVDLINAKVVRLIQGKYGEATVYSDNPVDIAGTWQKQGADRLHIVDLDGARIGSPQHLEQLKAIAQNIPLPVEFGGGVRTRADIEAVLAAGAKWVILGTKACEDTQFIQQATAAFGKKIIVSIDVKYGKASARGWLNNTAIEDVELIKKMQQAGVFSFIYTDITRDGTLRGIDTAGIERVLRQTQASIIYAGGISTEEDAKKLKRLENIGLAGIIIGKALYENRINLGQLRKTLEEKK